MSRDKLEIKENDIVEMRFMEDSERDFSGFH